MIIFLLYYERKILESNKAGYWRASGVNLVKVQMLDRSMFDFFIWFFLLTIKNNNKQCINLQKFKQNNYILSAYYCKYY